MLEQRIIEMIKIILNLIFNLKFKIKKFIFQI